MIKITLDDMPPDTLDFHHILKCIFRGKFDFPNIKTILAVNLLGNIFKRVVL